jgi:hypothetical protein
MTVIISGTEGVSDVDGSAGTPAIRGTDANTGIFFPAADTIAFAEGGAEAMRITSDAALGIGTTTPTTYGDSNTRFAVVKATSGNTYVNTFLGTDNVKVAQFINDDGDKQAKIGTTTNHPYVFVTNGTERARITSGGNFLVGATSTASFFDGALNSSGSTIPGLCARVTAQSSTFTIVSWNTATTSDNAFVTFGTEASFTGRGSIDYNRGAGLTRYNTTSDATLKNIIGDSDGQKSVEILNSTRIREFAWKDDETQKPQIGVIAQELHETFKGAVSVGGDIEKQRDVTEEVEEEYTDEEGNTQTRTVTQVVGQETYTEYRPWGVDKTAFTFHLVAGWQAHEKIIKQQADMIAALEARIAALEAR